MFTLEHCDNIMLKLDCVHRTESYEYKDIDDIFASKTLHVGNWAVFEGERIGVPPPGSEFLENVCDLDL